MEILVIQKKRYVAGLSHWLALPTRGKAKKLAAQKAKDLKAKGFCLRPSPIPQVGIADKWAFTRNGQEIKKPGLGTLYSLATAIAGNQPESWVGFFRLAENLWWVISVMNGVLVPDGDYLTEDLDAARKFYDLEVSRLPQESIPVEIPEVSESLQWLTEHLSTRYVGKLERYGGSQKQVLVAGAAGGILLIAAGGYFWHAHEQSIARQKERLALLRKIQQEQAKEKQKAVVTAKQKPISLPKPWVGKPFFAAYAQDVEGIFARVPLASFGWELASFRCDLHVCTATYHAQTPLATFWFIPKGAIANLQAGTVSRGYSIVSPSIAAIPQQEGAQHLARWLMGWMQANGIRGSVTPSVSDPTPLQPVQEQDRRQPKIVPPTWKTYAWSMQSAVPPWQMEGISVYGVVPQGISYDVGDQEWKVSGEMYEPIE